MHRIRYIFKRLPFLSNVVAYGTIYSMAEFSQQGVLMMCSPSKKETEWRKVGNHAIIGTVCIAPFLFCWYKALDFRIPSTSPGRIVLKCVLDQSIIAVWCIGIFFVAIMLWWTRTKQIFQKRPLLMNMASFGGMYVGAEMAQQAILMHQGQRKSLDWAVMGRYAVIGLAGIGPGLFYWYKWLDRALPAVTKAVVARKVLTDQLCSSPVCISAFFVGMSVLERRDDVFAELKAKFWSTYKLSCCFWLPAQAINFALLPPYTRVAFVGVASFIWVNVLCLVKRQEFKEVDDTQEEGQ